MLVLLLVAAFASERVWSLPLVDEHFTVHKHSAPHHSRLLVENCDGMSFNLKRYIYAL